MRFLLKVALIAAGAFLVSQFFDWWAQLLVALAVGLLFSRKKKQWKFGRKQKAPLSFLTGFVALFLLWGIMAYLINVNNSGVLSQKMANFLVPGTGESTQAAYILILATAAVGGLAGGFATMTGNLLGEAIRS